MLRWVICRNSVGKRHAGFANEALRGFRFLLALEQKTDAWMGSSMSAYSVDVARFFVSRGQLDKSLGSYDRFVTTRFIP